MFLLYCNSIYIFSPEGLGCSAEAMSEPVFAGMGRGRCSISHSWGGTGGKRGGKALPAFLLCPGEAPNKDCSERSGLNQLSSRAHPLTEACRTFIFSAPCKLHKGMQPPLLCFPLLLTTLQMFPCHFALGHQT